LANAIVINSFRIVPTSAGQKGQRDSRDKRDTGQGQLAVGGWQLAVGSWQKVLVHTRECKTRKDKSSLFAFFRVIRGQNPFSAVTETGRDVF
jgi:hypothetical protein